MDNGITAWAVATYMGDPDGISLDPSSGLSQDLCVEATGEVSQWLEDLFQFLPVTLSLSK